MPQLKPDWFLTDYKQQVEVAGLRVDVEPSVWVVSAGEVDPEQQDRLFPDGELPACQVSAAGPLCHVDLISVEVTAGDGGGRGETGDLHAVVR